MIFLKANARRVLDHLGVAAMGCACLKTYDELIEFADGNNDEISLLASSYVINGIDKIGPDRLGITPREYLTELDLKEIAAIDWNKLGAPLKNSVKREIRAKLDRKIITPQNQKIRTGTQLKPNKK